MAKQVIMPKFGFTQTEAEIVQWIKHEGDAVEKGEPICEVTTDKVNMEVEAPESGTLAGLRFREGDTVPVTAVIAYVLAPGESLPNADVQVSRSADEQMAHPLNATPVALRIAQELGIDLTRVDGTGAGSKITREDVERFAASQAEHTINHSVVTDGKIAGFVKIAATPSARRIAKELNVDLAKVEGRGPHGRVQGNDVLEQVSKSAEENTPAPLRPRTSAQTIPFTGIRKTIATRLQYSYQQVPHVTFTVDVDVTAIEALRTRANAKVREGQSNVSLTAILTKVCAWALARHPMMNSRLDLDANQIVLLDEVNVGIAVALDDGLIVPVIHDAQRKGVLQIANEIHDLSARARTNKLKPDDVSGGTFTISNLGMFDIDRFTAIINPPETAILAVGRAKKMIVPSENDQPIVRPIMALTLSADHRVVDGAIAARFMADLREALEHPEDILL